MNSMARREVCRSELGFLFLFFAPMMQAFFLQRQCDSNVGTISTRAISLSVLHLLEGTQLQYMQLSMYSFIKSGRVVVEWCRTETSFLVL